MDQLSYEAAPVQIRGEIPTAHRRAWRRLAQPGTWFTGEQRLAIAAEVRKAAACQLCAVRRQAEAPDKVPGRHDSLGALPPALVEVIHRIRNDPGRIDRAFYETAFRSGIPETHYVEALGVVATLTGVDLFCRGVGVAPHGLPGAATRGSPSRQRPGSEDTDSAWLPLLPEDGSGGPEPSLFATGPYPNVGRALSLVPPEVQGLAELVAAQYLPFPRILDPDPAPGRALDRPQIELIAGWLAAREQSFYGTTLHAMLLRASGERSGQRVDVTALTHGDREASGVLHGGILLAFAEAVVGTDPRGRQATRKQVVAKLGSAALVDAAGAVATSAMFSQITAATGVRLDPVLDVATQNLRAQLRIDHFPSAANTPPPTRGQKLLGKVFSVVPSSMRTSLAARAKRS